MAAGTACVLSGNVLVSGESPCVLRRPASPELRKSLGCRMGARGVTLDTASSLLTSPSPTVILLKQVGSSWAGCPGGGLREGQGKRRGQGRLRAGVWPVLSELVAKHWPPSGPSKCAVRGSRPWASWVPLGTSPRGSGLASTQTVDRALGGGQGREWVPGLPEDSGLGSRKLGGRGRREGHRPCLPSKHPPPPIQVLCSTNLFYFGIY